MTTHGFLEVAKQVQTEARRLGLGAPEIQKKQPASADLTALYDALISSEELRSTTRKLFVDSHYAEAVEEAYKCINNTVRSKSGLQRDGRDLMHGAFNEDDPVLKLNNLRTVSQRDEQAGYRFIFAGCMTGIRNPRAHGHDLRDDPEAALELLLWANHLMRVIGRARRARRKRQVKARPLELPQQ